MKRTFLLTSLLLCLKVVPVQAQFLKGIIINRYDRHALHHGKWKYIDKSRGRTLLCLGRFDHGKQVGFWQYFHPDGRLRMEEQYTWEGERRMVNVTFYHDNGRISNQGIAYVEGQSGQTHYYWNGDWIYFEPDGTFWKTVTYANGQPVKSTFADGSVEMETQRLPARQVEMPIK